MKSNILSAIRHTRIRIQATRSQRDLIEAKAAAVKRREEKAEKKLKRFLAKLPTILGFENARELVSAINENQPQTKAVVATAVLTGKGRKPGAKNTRITKEILADVKALAKQKIPDTHIAEKLNLKVATVKYARNKLGIKGLPGNPKVRMAQPAPQPEPKAKTAKTAKKAKVKVKILTKAKAPKPAPAKK